MKIVLAFMLGGFVGAVAMELLAAGRDDDDR